MSASLENIILVGGAGSLGKVILSGLTSSSLWVSVLSQESSSTSFPEGVTVFKTDYSPTSLAVALKGQDTIVSAIGDQGN
ncbi:hypothetical protein FISHEDRAFT_72751 [Fistulina hepatica ATCC 64428]|nr:hypothetical protein FISHEDRAFT_72751 [Fistulina hepatica ATCC 64428]